MILIDTPLWPAHGTVFAHLVSDTAYEELHAFASVAGVSPRAWDGDHYDVAREQYAAVLAAGALTVSRSELVRRLNASGLRLRKHKGEKGLARHLRVPIGEGVMADIDLVGSDRPCPDRATSAAATIVEDAGGDVLVVRSVRRATWDCPGGRREGTESVVDCARRELTEESGLVVDPATLHRCGYERIEVSEPGHWAYRRPYVQVFSARVAQRRPELTVGADDVDGAQWVDRRRFRELCEPLFWWPLAAHLIGARVPGEPVPDRG